jgi:hypothetical protein
MNHKYRFLSGCTIKATIDQIIDTTSNITGTTSGAAWWSEDGQIKPDFKTMASVRQPTFCSASQAGYAHTVNQDPVALLALLRDTSKPFID